MDIYKAIDREVERSREKFPSPDFLTTAFAEESGEVVNAILNHALNAGSILDVKKELIQTGAMIVRLIEEGDPIHRLKAISPPKKKGGV